MITLLLVVLSVSCNKEDDNDPGQSVPTITSSSPADDDTDVELDVVISITFSEEMDSESITASAFSVKAGTTAVEGVITYADSVATFTTASSLEPLTEYTVTLSTDIESSLGVPMESDHSFSFTTGEAELPIPTVTSSIPANEATGVALGVVISTSFSEEMDPESITAATFTVMAGTTTVEGVITYADSIATFAAVNLLEPETAYTITLSTEVKSSLGVPLASSHVFSFTTGEAVVTVPSVTATSPANEATAVAVNAEITATFSEAMDADTFTPSTFTLAKGTVAVSGAVVYAGTKATFLPLSSLTSNTVYTATITTAAKSAMGVALAASHSFTFTTTGPAPTVPSVASTSPAADATDVGIDAVVTATFSETMNNETITSSTFTLNQGTTAVAGTLTFGAMSATFTPSSPLEAAKVYTGTFTTDVKSAAGVPLAAIHTFSFTTSAAPDTALPLVSATDPANGATGVARNKVVSITFSEAMDPATITTGTFTLKNGTTAVAGTVAYSGVVATFTANNNLPVATELTATITTGAKDLAGNALAANTVWDFTTGGTLSTLAAVDLGAAANYVILAKTAINNGPTSAVTGDLGLSPAAASYITGLALTAATGYATSSQVTGKIYAADMADPTPTNLTTAVENMITAYNDAAGRPSPDFSELGTGNIGGKTLLPGLYKWTNTVSLPSNVTISGGENDIWIFQISGDLTVSSAVNVTLSGGAQAKNIFWQVAGEATFGTTSHFEGIILSMTGITFQTGASINGRALAQTAVILDSNAVTQPE